VFFYSPPDGAGGSFFILHDQAACSTAVPKHTQLSGVQHSKHRRVTVMKKTNGGNVMLLQYYGMHGWGMGLAWAIGILFLILVIWLVVRSVDRYRHDDVGVKHPEKTALNILKERYARGEIDKKEYEEKKRDLQS
jgi:putative membrane protein